MKTAHEFYMQVAAAPGDACWEWQGKTHRGYGYTRYQGKTWRAHRLAYTIWVGPIPKGAMVCHHCDNRKCCRPDHLFIGDAYANMRDARDKGRLKSNLPKEQRGEKHGHAVLTADDVALIRAARRTNEMSISELAKRFGVHHMTIRRANRGETWSHL